jgi:TonB family protein
MNRLQKKCVIATTGAHLSLLGILFFGSAFFTAKNKADNLPMINFIPVKTIDAAFSGGGNPIAQPPPPATPAPQPVQPVSQPPVSKPEPQKPVVKEPETKPKPAANSLEPSKEPKQKIDVSTKPVIRKSNAAADAKSAADARAKEIADAKRRAAEIGRVVADIKSGLSSSTAIELNGPGGGGVPYANFLQAVKSVYERDWNVPDGVTDDSATATVSVTIARDGTVMLARIIHSSGNAAVDRSVQVTLDRVKYAAPLPDDAKEEQRTVTINFNVKAKQALG